MTEITNTVKTPIKKIAKNPFSLCPKTPEEKAYIQSLKEILKNKRRGDWKLIAEMLNIPTKSAQSAFYRVYQKNHFECVDALKKIIKNRTQLLKVHD
ncbi:hypothetical protein [Chryseobacterium sp. WLY505]|uniref:hypothetical protein n=1 Tax=Chryseobacterium sp. WLY505 TaxID=3068892 RepID=UPI00279664A0|nr:hypothetical protein [Chryseobacterium sp. WLY505]MDQ1855715.1 hypothetical protein [Chryseobacterium sp. WLY505]